MYKFKKIVIVETLNAAILFAEGESSNDNCPDTGACDTTVNVGTC